MKVTFILPGWSLKPIGGYKVAYQYANGLADRGHEVTVAHWSPAPLKDLVKKMVFRIPWFAINPNIKMRVVKRIDENAIPDGDAVIATAWQTAWQIKDLSLKHGIKYHFIQHHEDWSGTDAELERVYHLPMRRIVIANWLKELLEKHYQTSVYSYVPNGIDIERFQCVTPPEERCGQSIAMMWHPDRWKGSAIGLQAIMQLIPDYDLRVTFFGTSSRPKNIPAQFQYVKRAKDQQLTGIYNDHALFISPSYREGWGLPATEAMACGACLVSSKNDGVLDYAVHDKNSLLFDVGDAADLSKKLKDLIANPGRRVTLAKAGVQDIQAFSLAKAVERFSSTIESVSGGGNK